jgi:uncharacterized protein YndB with AHSA1/START domain
MKADVLVTAVYRHPRERVWAALTSSAALAEWFMPNDFEPEVGRGFTFRTEPAPGFDGVVHCRVLELDPPARMVWSWAGGPIETTVTFTLEELRDGGTRLRAHQVGFHGLRAQLTRLILQGGAPRIYGERLPAYLDALAGRPARPVEVRCARGWRAYLRILRPWRAAGGQGG